MISPKSDATLGNEWQTRKLKKGNIGGSFEPGFPKLLASSCSAWFGLFRGADIKEWYCTTRRCTAFPGIETWIGWSSFWGRLRGQTKSLEHGRNAQTSWFLGQRASRLVFVAEAPPVHWRNWDLVLVPSSYKLDMTPSWLWPAAWCLLRTWASQSDVYLLTKSMSAVPETKMFVPIMTI